MNFVCFKRIFGVPAASHKTPLLALLGAVFALVAIGCGQDKTESATMNNGSSRAALNDTNSPQAEEEALAKLAFDQPPAKSGSRSGQAGNTASPSAWALVLGTFTGDGHETAAQTMIVNLRSVAPQLAAGSSVHITSKGSMVVYGRYSGRDDRRAKADLERIKAIEIRGRPLFNRVILTHLDQPTGNRQLNPHDLMAARQRYPDVDPLYTIDVGLWDDFGSGKMSWDKIRASAQSQCESLRSRGFDAYFYHDEQNQRSMVTVGLFDRRAIHPTSGMFSDEVMTIMAQFPERLVNGEPLLELVDPYAQRPVDKKLREAPKTKAQTPKLVLVPEM
jgi:hypothetical protein